MFATATAILLAVENAGAQSQPPDTSGPAYQADSDGDGVVDALDTCPSENVAMAGRSADPACYLGDATRPAMSWLADEYKRTGSASEGTFWTLAGCQPDRAFPVEDTTSDARQFRGVVITGIGEQTGCLLSIDYGNVPVVAIPRAPSLVELYATWNPELGAGGSYLPPDGLGLIRNGGVEFVNTRIPERSIVQRLKFTRGALYGVNLLVVNRICVGQTCAITLNPEPDWSILPTGLDDALMSQRTAIRTALNLPQPKDFPDSIDDAIEGVPRGWRVDDRYPFATPAARARGLESPPPSIVLSNRARLFAPLNYAGQDDVADSWLVVPEVIGNLGLEFLARPKGPPQYSPQRSAQDKLLVFQTFALPNSYDGISVDRNVEAIWPKANAADAIVASTSEASAAYGDRWTTNAGPTDCWDSEDDPNPVRYQFGSAGPDAKIADAWCPSAQRAWWASRPETNAQGGADRTCEAFQKSVADYKNAFLAAGNIVESVYCSIPQAVEKIAEAALHCGECGANRLVQPFCLFFCNPICEDCCDQCGTDLENRLPGGNIDAKIQECILPKFMDDAADIVGKKWDAHWTYIGSPSTRLVPVVGLVRGTEPSVESHMTKEGDMMIGHSHQLGDWNWGLNDFKAIDPAYRQMAKRRDASGGWTGLEVELEFGVPYGRWLDGGRGRSAFDLHGRGPREYLPLGGADVEWLGQVWPNNSCDLLGIDVGGPKTEPPYPTRACGGQSWPPPTGYVNSLEQTLWRTHYGRGIFAPMPIPDLLISDGLPFQVGERPEKGMLMELNPDWPTITREAGHGTYGITFDDWGSFPRRIAFLGQPIIDCGHAPYRAEIHPPQVITMESLNRRSRLKRDGVSIDGLPHDRKIELEAFGWVSVASPKHLEFDLWPTPRPNAAARLVIKGHDAKLTGDRRVPPAGNEAGVQQYGYVIDNSGPKHGTEEPTLACVPSPVDYPNHLHCEYDDAAGDRGSETGETDNYGNPRMTPFYATSRFELRVGMEWQ